MEFTPEETGVLREALDTFIRTRMGRADIAMEAVAYKGVRSDGRELDDNETAELRKLLLQASGILTGSVHGGPGIFSERVSNEARLARRIMARLTGDETILRMIGEKGEVLP